MFGSKTIDFWEIILSARLQGVPVFRIHFKRIHV